MAQLGIKVDDSVKAAFGELAADLGLSQSALIERMLEVMKQGGEQANSGEALSELQKKHDALQIANGNLQIANTQLANDNKALSDKLGLCESANQKKVDKSADLTDDVKELSNLTILRISVHNAVKSGQRKLLKSADISEDDAVDGLIKKYYVKP